MDSIMVEFVEELCSLSKHNDDGSRTTFVSSERIVADGPGAADITGKRHHMAFHSLPKCKQRGIRPKDSKGKDLGKTAFTTVDCRAMLRKDEEWLTYIDVANVCTLILAFIEMTTSMINP
jgi:hypothetical protein